MDKIFPWVSLGWISIFMVVFKPCLHLLLEIQSLHASVFFLDLLSLFVLMQLQLESSLCFSIEIWSLFAIGILYFGKIGIKILLLQLKSSTLVKLESESFAQLESSLCLVKLESESFVQLEFSRCLVKTFLTKFHQSHVSPQGVGCSALKIIYW